jgi:ornithine carbamoyltransferase
MKHFIDLNQVTPEEFLGLLSLAAELKRARKEGRERPLLAGKTLAMIFAKASTRTRVSFEAGMVQLGGYPLALSTQDLQIGRGEPISDTAKTLSRFVDAIMIRTFKQSDVEGLALHGGIPVINGLTDDSHPCQVLADLLTVQECKGGFAGRKLAYVGDGNNVANSLLHGCALVGMDVSVATPEGFECNPRYVAEARAFAAKSGAKVWTGRDAREAVAGADAVYTDTWVSMGMEGGKEERVKRFEGYQVDEALFSLAKGDAIFLHCLPAYRGFEVTEGVIDGPRSRVFDEAENRLHAQKAVLVTLLAGGGHAA